MSLALIPVRANRPSVLTVQGCTIYISVHDAEFERRVAELYAALLTEHHDKRRVRGVPRIRGEGFKQATSRLRTFLRAEYHWYAAVHLDPPQWDRWRRWAGDLTPSVSK